mgnify:CR=1 FL=1
MPNIKSAKKRVKIIETKTLQNSMIKTGYKTAVKKFEAAVEKNENVEETFKQAVKAIDTEKALNDPKRIKNIVEYIIL